MAPLLALLVLFKYLPIASALWNSTRLYSVAGQPVADAGLDNYASVLADPAFRDSLVRTLAFVAVKVPVQLAFGLLTALLVLQKGWLSTFARSSVFLPTVTAIVVVAVAFTFLFDRELGLVNAAIVSLGFERVGWLLEPRSAQFVILALSVWRDAGFVMLVFLAGLQAVPQSVLEAARMDGASPWQELRHVTIPLLSRSFQFAAVFSTLAAVQLVAPILVMTRGGPQDATDLAAYHVYEEAFSFFDWGRTSAMSVALLGVLVALTLVELRLLRSRWEY
jgi:ABC-type sugar transport system permease subunit